MNRPWTRADAEKSAASRLGIAVSRYRALRTMGKRHCSYHKRWHPASVFQMRAYPGVQFWRVQESCPDGHREASRRAMAARRMAGLVTPPRESPPAHPCKWGHNEWSRQRSEWRCLACHRERKARYRAQRRAV